MPSRHALRGDFDAPTRSSLDEAILKVHGGIDPAFDRLIDDHYDGLAPRLRPRLWELMRMAAPNATSIDDVVRAWTREDLMACYRGVLRERFAEIKAARDARSGDIGER